MLPTFMLPRLRLGRVTAADWQCVGRAPSADRALTPRRVDRPGTAEHLTGRTPAVEPGRCVGEHAVACRMDRSVGERAVDRGSRGFPLRPTPMLLARACGRDFVCSSRMLPSLSENL